jgi:hypothetical protein
MKEKTSAALGLDIGTSRIVAADCQGDEFRFRSQLNAFVAVPFSRITEKTLKKEQVAHLVEGNEIVIYGKDSERFADLFHLDTRRPMSKGTVNPAEPHSLSLIGQIVRNVTENERGDGKKLYFSVPAKMSGGGETVTYHEAVLQQLLEDLGYEAQSISEGLAVVYAELERTNYTGIGISCGGGLCNVCLAYLSAPLFSFSLPKAGDFIDSSAASVTNELATRVRIVKEASFGFNGHFADKVQQALHIYYMDMIQSIVGGLKEAFNNSLNVPKIGRPIPIVLSGGSALAPGFREQFEKVLGKTKLPVQISEVQLASDPLNTTAKGALVAALAEL